MGKKRTSIKIYKPKGKIKVTIIIPLYHPDKEILDKLLNIIKKQTIKFELITLDERMREHKAINKGIRMSKSEIIVTMNQDCVPENEYWLEKLIKPLEKDGVVATASVTELPYNLWKNFDIIAKALTIKEQKPIQPLLDERACAYRRKVLEEIGLFNEERKLMATDDDLYVSLKEKGRIEYPGCKVWHMHKITGIKRLKLEYQYAMGSGTSTKLYGKKFPDWWKRMIKIIPFIGILPWIYVFPIKRAPFLFLFYLLLTPILHAIYIIGFWKGYINNTED